MKLMAEVPDIHWQALLRHNRPLEPIIGGGGGASRWAGGTEDPPGTDIRVAAEDAGLRSDRGLGADSFHLADRAVRLRRQIPYTRRPDPAHGASHHRQKHWRFGLVGSARAARPGLGERRRSPRHLRQWSLSIRALMRMLREVDESHSEADALAKELEWQPRLSFERTPARDAGLKEKRKPYTKGE